jgi:hypothetical protein
MRRVVFHRAGHHVPDPQVRTNLLRGGLRPAVSPNGRSGDHAESGGRHSSELRAHLRRVSPAQLGLRGVSVQIVERQNGDECGVARRSQNQPSGNQQRQQPGGGQRETSETGRAPFLDCNRGRLHG